MKLIIAALAVAGCAAWGQATASHQELDSPHDNHCYMSPTPDDCKQPKPLKCGKYEYNASAGFANCHHDPDRPDDINIVVCTPVVDCKPIMHPVKEKEWQELNELVKKMQSSGKYLWWCKPGQACVRVFGDEIWVEASKWICPEGKTCSTERVGIPK